MNSLSKAQKEALQSRYLVLKQKVEARARETYRAVPTICAVSKAHTSQHIEALYEIGCRDFAENRVESIEEKQQALLKENSLGSLALSTEPIRWHFIGHLQSRKIPRLLKCDNLALIHSVPDLETLKKLEEQNQRLNLQRGSKLRLLLQANVTGESSKQGFTAQQWLAVGEQLERFTSFEIAGLMTMTPLFASSSQRSEAFDRLVQLREALALPSCQELSMGMSEDFNEAIAAGATLLRLGRILFEP